MSDYLTARAAHASFNHGMCEAQLKEYAVKREHQPIFELLQTLLEYHSDNALLKGNSALQGERLGLERAIGLLKRIRGES